MVESVTDYALSLADPGVVPEPVRKAQAAIAGKLTDDIIENGLKEGMTLGYAVSVIQSTVVEFNYC